MGATLFTLLTGNIGPLAQEWRDDPQFFRSVNLEDPTFRNREVTFSFDGDAEGFRAQLDALRDEVRKEQRRSRIGG